MPAYDNQTIAALATAAGGPVAIIRLSGARALAAVQALWRPMGQRNDLDRRGQERRLLLGRLYDAPDGNLIDSQCLAIYMPGPESYTGEDVVELHLHGGAMGTRLALQALARQGVRGALHGEFTRRAFLNGKMDLTQAEAVAEMIGATSAAALSLANRQLAGQMGSRVNGFYDQLQLLLSELESHLDFPEEELDWMPTPNLIAELDECREALLKLAATRTEGEVLRGGVTLAIAGAPNAGKSSLLNRLLGRDRAIVSEMPGTTRDTVEAECVIRRIPFRIVDTAGIRESDDRVEQAGVERSRQAVADADVVLWLMDATLPPEAAVPFPADWPHRGTVVTVANKCDVPNHHVPEGAVAISALSGANLAALETALETAVFGEGGGVSGELAVSSRHAALLEQAAAELETAAQLLQAGASCNEPPWETAAIPLRAALAALGEVTGRAVSPDILDTIFHRFCIGK